MSLYNILGVKSHDTNEIINRAFKTLARSYHPDKDGSTQIFQRMLRAKLVLCDKEFRKIYDQYGDGEELNEATCERNHIQDEVSNMDTQADPESYSESVFDQILDMIRNLKKK